VYRVPGFVEARAGDIVSEAGRVVFLGEVHEREWLVGFMTGLLEALARDDLDFLGVEWFNVEQQGLLDAWLEGSLSWEGLVEEYRKGPEGFNLDVYRPLLEAARGLGVRIVGVMPPRSLARRVSREGVIPWLPEGAPDPAVWAGRENRRLVSSLFPRQGPMAGIPVERLLLAQSYKDSVAAWVVAGAARRGRGLVVMGWVHVEPVGSVPSRVEAMLGEGVGPVVGAREEGLEGLAAWYGEWAWALLTRFYVLPG